MGLTGAQGAQPFRGACQRPGEGPANQNQGQRSDEHGLHQGAYQRVAQCVRDLAVNVGSVVNQCESANELAIAMKRQSVNVKGRAVDAQELPITGVTLGGTRSNRGTQLEK